MKIASSMIYDLLKKIKWDFKINTLSMILCFININFCLNWYSWMFDNEFYVFYFQGVNKIIKQVSTKFQKKNALV